MDDDFRTLSSGVGVCDNTVYPTLELQDDDAFSCKCVYNEVVVNILVM